MQVFVPFFLQPFLSWAALIYEKSQWFQESEETGKQGFVKLGFPSKNIFQRTKYPGYMDLEKII